MCLRLSSFLHFIAKCALLLTAIELRGYIKADYLDDFIMGRYTVVNEIQCRRLCWYRQLCRGHNYIQNNGDDAIYADNCILYAAETNYGYSPSDGCRSYSASCVSVINTCAPRQCGPAEVCVPSGPFFKCLSLPARCGEPEPVENATVIASGHRQEEIATVQCNPGYVVVPRDTAIQLRCQVTSKWTLFQGTCVKAEFRLDPPESKFVTALTSAVSEGWAMCAKGNFTGKGQLYLNLQESSDNALDVYFHLALKYEFKDNEEDDVRWNRKVNGTFQGGVRLGAMPYVPGEDFAISMLVLKSDLRVILHGHDTYDVPLADVVNITDAKYCMISGEVNTTYVNFASVCDES